MGGSVNRSPLMSRNQNFLNTDGNKNVYNLLCKLQKENLKSDKENVNCSNRRLCNNDKSTGFRKNTVSFS